MPKEAGCFLFGCRLAREEEAGSWKTWLDVNQLGREACKRSCPALSAEQRAAIEARDVSAQERVQALNNAETGRAEQHGWDDPKIANNLRLRRGLFAGAAVLMAVGVGWMGVKAYKAVTDMPHDESPRFEAPQYPSTETTAPDSQPAPSQVASPTALPFELVESGLL